MRGGRAGVLALLTVAACFGEEGSSRFDEGERTAGETNALALFDVPRSSAPQPFHHLPFPNDLRRSETGLDLRDHPNPGRGAGREIVEAILSASAEDLDGFGINPVVSFHFSEALEPSSIAGRIVLVDVDEASPTYGRVHPVEHLVSNAPLGAYTPAFSLAVRTPHGAPLRPATTYALILSTGIATVHGAAFRRSTDLEAILREEPPNDPDARRAHSLYAPLRRWLAATHTPIDTVLSATVFRTQNGRALVPALRAVVHESAPPRITDLTLCQPGETSPCATSTGGDACGTDDPRVIEIHGRIHLPIFQQGAPPYFRPNDGGHIARDAVGRPIVVREEGVCFALTLPRTDPPSGGHPVVIYAHGTGGSHRSARSIAGEVGEPHALGSGAATIAIDLPQHGSRRGGSLLPPDLLFFNVENPRASRDNVLQGAADLFSLVYAIASRSFAESDPAFEVPLPLDPTRIVIFAHSQGATHASLMLPFEPLVTAAVLSGNGGDLRLSLLHKTSPVNVAALLPALLSEDASGGALPGGSFHPALNLVQMFFDRADPVNYAPLLRGPAVTPHVFMTFGLADSYSPEETMFAFARAAGFSVVEPLLGELDLLPTPSPLLGNVIGGAHVATQGLRQYAPEDGSDGHFVATSTGWSDALRFLREALAGDVPAIGD